MSKWWPSAMRIFFSKFFKPKESELEVQLETQRQQRAQLRAANALLREQKDEEEKAWKSWISDLQSKITASRTELQQCRELIWTLIQSEQREGDTHREMDWEFQSWRRDWDNGRWEGLSDESCDGSEGSVLPWPQRRLRRRLSMQKEELEELRRLNSDLELRVSKLEKGKGLNSNLIQNGNGEGGMNFDEIKELRRLESALLSKFATLQTEVQNVKLFISELIHERNLEGHTIRPADEFRQHVREELENGGWNKLLTGPLPTLSKLQGHPFQPVCRYGEANDNGKASAIRKVGPLLGEKRRLHGQGQGARKQVRVEDESPFFGAIGNGAEEHSRRSYDDGQSGTGGNIHGFMLPAASRVPSEADYASSDK